MLSINPTYNYVLNEDLGEVLSETFSHHQYSIVISTRIAVSGQYGSVAYSGEALGGFLRFPETGKARLRYPNRAVNLHKQQSEKH